MNEEELFCKLFPEYVVNGKPLSPYFDLFESGYEQAEKRIAELEERVWRQKKKIVEKTKKIADLEKENAELRKDKKELCHSISEGGKACVYLNEQLTKAKEIIKAFLDSSDLNIKHKAEEFLGEF